MDSRTAKLLQRCNHEPDRSDQLLENSGAKIRIEISRQNILRSVWDLQVSKNLFQNIFHEIKLNIQIEHGWIGVPNWIQFVKFVLRMDSQSTRKAPYWKFLFKKNYVFKMLTFWREWLKREMNSIFYLKFLIGVFNRTLSIYGYHALQTKKGQKFLSLYSCMWLLR